MNCAIFHLISRRRHKTYRVGIVDGEVEAAGRETTNIRTGLDSRVRDLQAVP